MVAHSLQWHTPLPLWARFGATVEQAATASDQLRPALLRFASDDFMDELLDVLAREPARLAQLLARPETWRTPPGSDGNAGEGLISRLPLPRLMQRAARARAHTRAPQAIEPVAASRALTERSLRRDVPLKLFQPAHQRYYLVGASLVCRVGGLPERKVVGGGAEQIGFVVRRLLPATAAATDSSAHEFAFVKDAQGARWQRVSDSDAAAALAPGEELLPLFPLQFRDELAHGRTLWAGFVPVARREEYLATRIERTAVSLAAGQRAVLRAQPASAPSPDSKQGRLLQFQMEVAEPWKALIRAAAAAAAVFAEPTKPEGMDGDGEKDPPRKQRVLVLNLQWQMQSWLILLDFADYLAAHLPAVWSAIEGTGTAGALSQNQRALYDWLGSATMSAALSGTLQTSPAKAAATSLREALKRIRTATVRAGLEGTTNLYAADNAGSADWPDFHFLLAGIDAGFQLAGAAPLPAQPAAASEVEPDAKVGGTVPGQTEAAQLDKVTALVVRALPSAGDSAAPPLPFAVQLRDALADAPLGDPGWFVVRCVQLNRDCGPLHPPLLSAPTQKFQLASFFDPDAPARPIRITLPADTTPAGLRKHSKNTAFVLSDVLCGQVQRAKGLGFVDLVRQVLPWPLHKDIDVGAGGPCRNGGGINIGMICSLSIPIITLCALILLMIIVLLLDFIFRWMPYFILCLPVPKLNGKKG